MVPVTVRLIPHPPHLKAGFSYRAENTLASIDRSIDRVIGWNHAFIHCRFYCPSEALSRASVCPAGSYCTSGLLAPLGCPVGTYNSQAYGGNTSDCLPCDPGKYCSSTMQTAPSDLCSAGYYCNGSTITSTPMLGATGGPCPMGSYCAQVTTHASFCSMPSIYRSLS
jgi:hypothetical protein